MSPLVFSRGYCFMIWIWKIQGILVSCRIRLHCATARQEEHLSFLCRGSWGGRCVPGVLMTTSQTYSVVTERHWRHCLRVWTLWTLGVVWPFLCYLPGLYSSKPSKAFLRIHQLKPQRSSALTLNSPGSVCCKCLCYVATIPYVCGLLIGKLISWMWLLKTCCTGRVAQRAVSDPRVHAYPHLHSVVFSFIGRARIGECMQWKKKYFGMGWQHLGYFAPNTHSRV